METGVGFSLSGPKYFKRFSEIMLNMVTRYGVNMFKIDGIGFEGDRTIIAQEMSGMLKLCKEVRAKAAEGRKPGANDLFISLTTGTWPSPFWLQHGDSIWRGHGDIGIEGPRECPWRLRWVTYRDAVVYHLVHRKSPWFPLSSLMLHGIIVGAVGQSRAARLNHLFSEGKEKKRDITDFEHEVWTYFGMGVNLQELYLSPDLMTPEAWDVVAKAAKWSRSNVEVFQDSHWIGGDPLEYQMGVVYGFASFSPRLKRATITLRNPSMKTALYNLDLRNDLELGERMTDYKFKITVVYGPHISELLTADCAHRDKDCIVGCLFRRRIYVPALTAIVMQLEHSVPTGDQGADNDVVSKLA